MTGNEVKSKMAELKVSADEVADACGADVAAVQAAMNAGDSYCGDARVIHALAVLSDKHAA